MNLQGQAFAASGTFIVPPGVTSIFLTEIGAGGGGGGSSGGSLGSGGAGGGAGAFCDMMPLRVVSGALIPVTVGAGGTAGPAEPPIIALQQGGKGGTTSFGPIIAEGGWGGMCGETQDVTDPIHIRHGPNFSGGGNGGGPVQWSPQGQGSVPNGGQRAVAATHGLTNHSTLYGRFYVGSGGGGGAGNANGGAGAYMEAFSGGRGATGGGGGSVGGGGGGAASQYGAGAPGPATDTAGASPAATAYGAGASGSSVTFGGFGRNGGVGAGGYVLVQWVA